MKKVVKFGGSSLASARQFKKVKAIIDADKTRCYVVPSAPGKRDSKDTKVTDMLYQCYDAASTGQSYKRILDQIKKRYTDIIDGLELNLNLDFEFSKIEENFLNKVGRDYAASRGEYLNGLIMANYLGFTFVDAADVIRFDADGNFLSEETNEEMREHLASLKQAVIPGLEQSTPSPAAAPISQVPSLPVRSRLISMRTGPMSPVSLSLTRGSSTIRLRSKRSLTQSSVSSPTWAQAFSTRMRSSR